MCYTHAHLWLPPLFLAVNHHNIENWVPSILTHNLWLIFMWMKQKKIKKNFEKKFKMADSKKAHFSKSPILKIFSRKSLRSVLGLVGLNDSKGIDVAQCIWPWGCLTKAQKQPKNAFSVLFGCFWAFVGQPHGHIRWATSMPFASFNPIKPRTNLRNFREKKIENWRF